MKYQDNELVFPGCLARTDSYQAYDSGPATAATNSQWLMDAMILTWYFIALCKKASDLI